MIHEPGNLPEAHDSIVFAFETVVAGTPSVPLPLRVKAGFFIAATRRAVPMKQSEIPTPIQPCRSLSCEAQRCIMQKMAHRQYRPGELIVPAKGVTDHIGYLASGQAEAYAHTRQGARVAAYTIQPGDFFGDLACLTENRSLVTIVCRQQSSVYLQPYDDFMAFLDQHTDLKCRFLQAAFDKLWLIYRVVGNEQTARPVDPLPAPYLPATVQKAVHFINSHFEMPLTVTQVAQVAGLSKSAFSRRFKNALGVSFKTYLNQLRISRAKHLISTEGYNVTEACYAVGFNDTAYFSRTFRRIEGESPSSLKLSMHPEAEQKKAQKINK